MVETYEPPVDNADHQFSVGSGNPEDPVVERSAVPPDAWIDPRTVPIPGVTPSAESEVPTQAVTPPAPLEEEQAQ